MVSENEMTGLLSWTIGKATHMAELHIAKHLKPQT
jgi:hypothetical protein